MSYEKRINKLPNKAVDNGNSSAVAMISLVDAAWVTCEADKEVYGLKLAVASLTKQSDWAMHVTDGEEKLIDSLIIKYGI